MSSFSKNVESISLLSKNLIDCTETRFDKIQSRESDQ